jgi:phosphopantetheinyl transferase
VALSVGAQEHGLDIQEFRPKTVPESLARWALCPHERLAFGESMDPVLFTRVWAMKEAFVKATGEGLARGLNTFSVWPPESGARKIEGRETHFFLMEAKGAAMALASLAPTSPPPVISLNSNLAGLIEKVNADKDFMPPLTPIYTDYEQ